MPENAWSLMRSLGMTVLYLHTRPDDREFVTITEDNMMQIADNVYLMKHQVIFDPNGLFRNPALLDKVIIMEQELLRKGR